MCHWRCGKCNKREINNKGEYNGTNHFLVKEKEKNEKEKMWKMLLDVFVLSGVPRRWGIIGITNIKGITIKGGKKYERRQRTLSGLWRKRGVSL